MTGNNKIHIQLSRLWQTIYRTFISPKFWQWYHGVWAAVFVLLYPLSLMVWKESVPFLMFLSMQTALSGALGGFVASIAGRKADSEDDGM